MNYKVIILIKLIPIYSNYFCIFATLSQILKHDCNRDIIEIQNEQDQWKSKNS